jgi:hypothetical protein
MIATDRGLISGARSRQGNDLPRSVLISSSFLNQLEQWNNGRVEEWFSDKDGFSLSPVFQNSIIPDIQFYHFFFALGPNGSG